MKIVKLSTPWNHNYYSQFPEGNGLLENYRFEVNNDCDECDWWIIWGGLQKKEHVRVSSNQIVYVTDEAHEQRFFDKDFLNQFAFIFSVRSDLLLHNVIQIHELAPWYFNKSFDEIQFLKPLIKTKPLSVVSSDLTWLPGHKKRFAYVNKLIGHFKDKIDVYGRGFNAVPDKFDALAAYKYSIAIENNCIPNYFTEKISECFLTYTLPIYYGCPNISDYYNDQSYISIDIEDYRSSFLQIEKLIEEDIYDDRLPYVIESREKYLQEYHLYPALVKFIKGLLTLRTSNSPKSEHNIFPEEHFITRSALKNANLLQTGKMFFKVLSFKLN